MDRPRSPRNCYRIAERDGGRIVEEAEECPAPRPDHLRAQGDLRQGRASPNAWNPRSSSPAATGSTACRGRAFRKPCSQISERAYPFGWLGIMSETPPVGEVIYARHERGFALASLRNPMLSRYYIQCGLDTRIEDWPGREFMGGVETTVFPTTSRVRSLGRGRRSKNRSRRCAASSPSRCATATCFSLATPRISCPQPGRRASILRSLTSSISSALSRRV